MYSNFAFLAAISVWVPFIPGAPETQSLVAILFIFYGLVRALPSRGGGGESEFMRIFVFFFLSLLPALFWGIVDNSPSAAFGSLLKYSIGPVFFIMLHRHKVGLPSPKMVKFVILIHIPLAIMYLIGLGDIFALIFPRGAGWVGYLSYEPSYAATYLFIMAISAFYSLETQKSQIFYGLISVFLILSTQSLLGLIYAVIASSIYFKSSFKFQGVMVFAIALILYLAPDDGRFGMTIQRLLSNFDWNNLAASFVMLEPSGTTRLLVNISAILLGAQSYLGSGLGSFDYYFGRAVQASNYVIFESHPILNAVYYFGEPTGSQSYFAAIAFEGGLLGILGFLLMLWFAILKPMNLKCGVKSSAMLVYILLFCVFQSQIFNPLYWYVFYIFSIINSRDRISIGRQ